MSAKTLVVLGGGITGLSTAYYLNKFCSHLGAIKKIIVLESSSHLGGWLKTHTFEDGVKHEFGPRTLRVPTNPGFNALALAEDIGLADEIIANPAKSTASRKRMILYQGELVELPSKIKDIFFRRKPLPKSLLSYALKDLRTPKLDLTTFGDISVYDFISRRLGSDVADYFVDPLCRGITAGDAKKLSAISMFPQMVRGEQEMGSICGGALATAQRDKFEALTSPLVSTAKENRWSTITFRDGIQTLPDQLCNVMLDLKGNPIEIYNESTVQKIDFDQSTQKAKITVSTAEDTIEVEADHIFSSIPAHNLAKVLPQYPDLSEVLNQIQTVHVAVVNLEFKGQVMPSDAGFGYLVPSKEKSNVLGVIFDSCVTPELNAGKDITRLTVMIGGEWFEELFGDVNTVDKQLALDMAVDAIRSDLKITSHPNRHIVSIHKNCIPQYYLGHRLRLEKINQLIGKYSLTNLTLLGASYQGFSVPDCILGAKQVADRYYRAIKKGVQIDQVQEEADKEKKSIAQ